LKSKACGDSVELQIMFFNGFSKEKKGEYLWNKSRSTRFGPGPQLMRLQEDQSAATPVTKEKGIRRKKRRASNIQS